MREPVIHLLQRMNDEVHRRVQRFVDRKLADEPVLELQPEIDPLGQALVVDDDEEVEIRPIALGGMRLVDRSEEHTSELQSLMRISYAVFCLKKKNNTYNDQSKYRPDRYD